MASHIHCRDTRALIEAPQGDLQLRQRVQQMLEDQRRQLDALQHEISEDWIGHRFGPGESVKKKKGAELLLLHLIAVKPWSDIDEICRLSGSSGYSVLIVLSTKRPAAESSMKDCCSSNKLSESFTRSFLKLERVSFRSLASKLADQGCEEVVSYHINMCHLSELDETCQVEC